jgi:hypothetical protein
MLKPLYTDDTQNTPFIVTKEWNLSNVDDEDLVELEQNENTVALEFIHYTTTASILNSSCNIAFEHQSKDKAIYRYGTKGSGIFYPDQEPTNLDGTFQRVVYSQIITMFYNNYRDPSKMWGLEKLDFDLSKTRKFISDKFSVIDIPTSIFGEKVLENTVVMVNNRSDNEYTTTDDGNNNLYAGTNLFSKQQEIGTFYNVFISGSSFDCSEYFNFSIPSDPYALTASHTNCSALTVSLNWFGSLPDGFVVEKSLNSGSTFSVLSFTPGSVTNLVDTSVSYYNTYWYRVYSYNSFGSSSGYTNIASASVLPCPPLGNVVLTVTSGSADLSWSYSLADNDGYNIDKSTDGNVYSFLASIGAPFVTEYIDSGVSAGNTYWYRVNAYNDIGTSSWSNTASIFLTAPSINTCKHSPFSAQLFTESLQTHLFYDLT